MNFLLGLMGVNGFAWFAASIMKWMKKGISCSDVCAGSMVSVYGGELVEKNPICILQRPYGGLLVHSHRDYPRFFLLVLASFCSVHLFAGQL